MSDLERMERALDRLIRAAVRHGDVQAREWALSAPGEAVAWEGALPDEVRLLLERRKEGPLYLPSLQVDPWQKCAQDSRDLPPGEVWLYPSLRYTPRGVFTRWGAPVAERLVELVELEAVLLERLPGSRARGFRIGRELAPWQSCAYPSGGPGHEALDTCPPGTLLCADDASGYLVYALKLDQRLWVLAYEIGSDPGDLANPLLELRANAFRGEVQVGLSARGARWWRSSVSLQRREPMEQMLARLDQALLQHAPFLRETLLPPEVDDALSALEQTLGLPLPESLRQLWQGLGDSEATPFRYGCRLLGPTEARELILEFQNDAERASAPDPLAALVPLLHNDEEAFVGVDARGDFAPRGAPIAWRLGSPQLTVLYETLEDWLEAFVLELEQGQWDPYEDSWELEDSDFNDPLRYDYPRDLDLNELEQAGIRPVQEQVTPIEQALSRLQADRHGQTLLQLAADALVRFDDAWKEQPDGPAELSVLRDWLTEQGTPLGTGTLATLVARVAPLIKPDA